MIDDILKREEFTERPPVLVDIGASGRLHREWEPIMKHSIVIAFDADERELAYLTKQRERCREFHLFRAVVTDRQTEETEFYLTKSPYCSSLLEPDAEGLSRWAFSGLFEVEAKVKVKATTLPSVLKQLRFDRVDWFKTDSQGLDLRLFAGLGDELVRKVLVADFEPGILDAYKEEDKLHDLMMYMDARPFWMSDMNIHGSQRVSRDMLQRHLSNFQRRYIHLLLKSAPGWCEVSYFNRMDNTDHFGRRDFLLAWVFATLKGQHGFALEVASVGELLFGDTVFAALQERALSKIRCNTYSLPVRKFKNLAERLLRRIAR